MSESSDLHCGYTGSIVIEGSVDILITIRVPDELERAVGELGAQLTQRSALDSQLINILIVRGDAVPRCLSVMPF